MDGPHSWAFACADAREQVGIWNVLFERVVFQLHCLTVIMTHQWEGDYEQGEKGRLIRGGVFICLYFKTSSYTNHVQDYQRTMQDRDVWIPWEHCGGRSRLGSVVMCQRQAAWNLYLPSYAWYGSFLTEFQTYKALCSKYILFTLKITSPIDYCIETEYSCMDQEWSSSGRMFVQHVQQKKNKEDDVYLLYYNCYYCL